MTSTKYAVRGSYSIRSSNGYDSMDEACKAIERQRTGLVSMMWPDGTIAYYLSRDDADNDRTGERAAAIATIDD